MHDRSGGIQLGLQVRLAVLLCNLYKLYGVRGWRVARVQVRSIGPSRLKRLGNGR